MKTSLFLGTALGLLLASSVASAAQTHFKATLNGAQETPPFTTSATGSAADLVYDDTSNDLTGTITITGIADGDFVQAHIHSGACGVAGNILVQLPDQASNMIVLGAGDVVIDQAADIQDLMDGKLYINVHTAANGGNGDIRGQIYPMASTTTCPASGSDAGASDGGSTSSSSGSSGASSSSGASGSSSSSSSSGASTTRPDSGTTTGAAPKDDSGCNTTGSSDSSNGLAVAFGLGVAFVGFARARKNKKS